MVTERKLLVVDDNRDGADTLAEWLEQLGHTVRVAYDGAAALQISKEFIPDLALLDLEMPGMDGYELAGRMRQRSELDRVSLVAVTGYRREADGAKFRQAGFATHLLKPVDPEHLNAVIEELTDGAADRRPLG